MFKLYNLKILTICSGFAFIVSGAAFLLYALPTRADITTGLIHHWTFDEGSGSVAADSAGSFTGTLTNGPVWTTGHSGNALSFDGVNDYVNLSTAALGVTNEITVSAWVKATGTLSGWLYQGIVTRGQYVAPFWLQREGTAGLRTVIRTSNTSYLSAANALTANTWRHLVLTYRANERILYVDGVVVASNAPSGASLGNLNAGELFTIGAMPGGTANFKGLIDDVRIYNRALSAAEVASFVQN
ncbi:MAG: LamG domain-containing protein [bacterium]|nr:LamG domain-containing protein [bacterium]